MPTFVCNDSLVYHEVIHDSITPKEYLDLGLKMTKCGRLVCTVYPSPKKHRNMIATIDGKPISIGSFIVTLINEDKADLEISDDEDIDDGISSLGGICRTSYIHGGGIFTLIDRIPLEVAPHIRNHPEETDYIRSKYITCEARVLCISGRKEVADSLRQKLLLLRPCKTCMSANTGISDAEKAILDIGRIYINKRSQPEEGNKKIFANPFP